MTPENFLAVLKGDSASVKGGSGKVLKRQVMRGGKEDNESVNAGFQYRSGKN